MDYEVTPERPGDGTPDERSSTAHHESLLRAERARAARSRRALGSFVVAGLAAATVVGVVTWQSVANEEEGRSTQVQEGTHETSLPSAAPDDTSGDPSSRPAVPETGDEPENYGDVSEQGAATTTQDQYLAPNTWYDGQGSYEDNPGFGDGSDGDHGSDGDQGAEGTEGNATGAQGEGDGAEGAGPESPNLPSDEHPWLTELLPTIPDLPTVPGESDPSGAPDEDDEENNGNTETEEDGQSTPGSSPGNSSEPANPAGDVETSSAGMEPTEPGGTGNTGDTADTDSTGNDDEAAESPTVTDTTGPSPE